MILLPVTFLHQAIDSIIARRSFVGAMSLLQWITFDWMHLMQSHSCHRVQQPHSLLDPNLCHRPSSSSDIHLCNSGLVAGWLVALPPCIRQVTNSIMNYIYGQTGIVCVYAWLWVGRSVDRCMPPMHNYSPGWLSDWHGGATHWSQSSSIEWRLAPPPPPPPSDYEMNCGLLGSTRAESTLTNKTHFLPHHHPLLPYLQIEATAAFTTIFFLALNYYYYCLNSDLYQVFAFIGPRQTMTRRKKVTERHDLCSGAAAARRR